MIEQNKKIVRFRFAIKLHIDDVNTLYYIQNELNGIGIVRKYSEKYYAEYIVLNFNDIKEVIVPIFEKFKLITKKEYSFSLFAKAIKLKSYINLNKEKGIRMSDNEFNDILYFKLKMSNKDGDINENNSIPNLEIIPMWLLGFVKGEGTFGYKYTVRYFQIAQHKRSVNALNSIENYLLRYIIEKSNNKIKDFQMIKVINKRTNILSYSIQDIDILYKYIVPFFANIEFKSRKKLDFYMWSVALKIRVYGYHTLIKGKSILLKISKGTNKYRYTNSKLENYTLPTKKDIKNLFSMPPIFHEDEKLTHREYTILYGQKNNSRKGYRVYVYKNKVGLSESPFMSYALVTKILNINSNIIRRYIDTGKEYNNKFIFSSFKL